MSRLHQWFEDKNKKVHRDLEDLKMKEETQKHEEEHLQEKHTDLERQLEEKEMQGFNVLNKFYQSLHGMAVKSGKRKRFAKEKTEVKPEEEPEARKKGKEE